MDTKERHVRENEDRERREALDQVAHGMRAESRERRNDHTRKMNRLWLWLGIIIIILILFWWLFSIGTFEALIGTTNG